MNKYAIYLTVCLWGLCGCDDEPIRGFPSPSYRSYDVDIPHYAQGYWDYDDIRCAGIADGYAIIGIASNSLLHSYRNDDSTYEDLCLANGDVDYVPREAVCPHDNIYRVFSALNITTVEVVSDAAFDAAHPAGSSLADVAYYAGATAKPYVDSRYRLYDVVSPFGGDGPIIQSDWSSIAFDTEIVVQSHLTSPYSTYIVRRLDKISAGEFRMAGIQSITRGDYDNGGSAAAEDFVLCLLSFDKPALSQSHNFTATFTFDDGRQMSVEFPMDWSEEDGEKSRGAQQGHKAMSSGEC